MGRGWPMVEVNPSDQSDCKDRLEREQVEKPALNSPEVQQVRNATGDQVEAIRAANPDAHDGSATPKDRAWLHKQALIEEQSKSLELFEDDKLIAARVMEVARPAVIVSANELPAKELPVDELDMRPIRYYGWGFKPDVPTMAETGLEYQKDNQVDYRGGFKKPEITQQEVFERVAALSLGQQAQVLNAGFHAYHQEISQQEFRMVVGHITGVGESVVGMSQGVDSLCKSICDVAQFSRDIAESNPRAAYTAEQASKSFGKLVVGGIKVVEVADNYLGSVGAASYEGDNTKAFRDMSALGQRMNLRWAEMSTEEKSSFTTKLTLDNLGPIAAAGAGSKLAKSIDLAEALQDLGASASIFGAKEREKYSNVIAAVVDRLGPELVTETGHKVKWRDVSKTAEQASDENISRMSPFFEKGKKAALEAGSKRAAEITGLPEEQIKRLVQRDAEALERMTKGQLIYMEKVYRETYLIAHPEYRNYHRPFEVHHRIPQDVLEKHPQLFSHREIHDASNLVGIPRDTKAHTPIKGLWWDFFDTHPKPSKQDVIDFAIKIDTQNKRHYLP